MEKEKKRKSKKKHFIGKGKRQLFKRSRKEVRWLYEEKEGELYTVSCCGWAQIKRIFCCRRKQSKASNRGRRHTG